jgi:hypothetical protein
MFLSKPAAMADRAALGVVNPLDEADPHFSFSRNTCHVC